MSGRFKRHISKASTSTGDGNGGGSSSGAMARKKRRMENGSSEDEERSFWTPKHLGDLKAYNRSASEAPAELFRKDLISAMKLADNEPLTQEDYWGISDQWKQEWERGVQVPVNPDSLPESHVSPHKEYPKCSGDFRLPRRFIRVTHSDFFNNEKHVLSNLPTKAEKMCRYDMDNLDDAWLKSYNGERARMGAEPVPHQIFELIIEHFEETCLENIHKLLKAEETLSIEFDEDVICDVCRSPDREEGNEMVFCDICNICVHQACYGITAIPSGSWLCRTCSLGIKPNCDLCPNKGGAMKSTKSGHKWAHVACALWIPEVSIGSVERMEPITKITNIPQSRWALVCVLCRERRGACIQCSVKSCKTAYHVTCAFKHGLEMKAIVEEENTDDVKLRSYCEKHSMTNKKDTSDAESDTNGSTNQKKKKDLTNEQKSQARAAKLRQIEAEFFNHVDVLQTSTILDIDFETTETIFYYWKLKRRAGFNKPLLTPRSQELDILSEQQEQDIERMKMFVQLRQYLERVRNLCYMVSRREKMSKSYLKSREQTFAKQALLLNDPNLKLSTLEIDAIAQANHSHTVYDKIYSHKGAVIHTQKQFENIVRIIACSTKSEIVSEEEIEKPKKNLAKDINGLIKSKVNDSLNFKNNPYRKTYFNGAEQRRSRSRSISHCGSTETSSTEDSDSSLASTKWKPPAPGTRISVFTSSEDEKIFNKNNKTINVDHKSKTSQFTLHPPKFKTPYSSEEEDRSHTMKSLPPPSKSSRGKRPVKRGRGRPRGGPRVLPSSKENSLFSSEEDKGNHSPSKFDALIKSSKATLVKNEELNKSFIDSSEEEEDKKKSPSKRSHKKSTPIKVEALSSSEEDLPIISKSSPQKRGKGRGRGRGRGSSRPTSLSSNPLSFWGLPSKTKGSDDDDLGPAIYKLTSEEEDKSDKSGPGTDLSLRRKELFGPSSDNKSDLSDNDCTNKKELKGSCAPSKRFLRRSDTDAVDSDDGKESGGESLNCNQMKTKAAMKEFTPKIAAKVEKFNNTKRGTRHSASNDKIPKEIALSDMSVKDSSRLSDIEHSRDINLFVPQRAAAKKASELITSQNTGLINACLAGSNIVGPVSENLPTDGKKPICKSKELENGPTFGLNEEPSNYLRKSASLKNRRGRSSKDRLESKDDSDSEPPKKNIFDPPEILPYVPIREAARKAAENLKVAGKSGLTAVPAVPEDVLEPCITPTKEKKEGKIKIKSQLLRTTRNKSPRSAMKLLTDADSDSDEENEPSVNVPINNHKKSLQDTSEERVVDKGKSIFSESEDESLLTPKKDKILVEKTCESGKGLPHKQQLFRGDIFVCDHQSSSENEDDKGEKHQTAIRGRTSPIKAAKEMLGSEYTTKGSERRSKNNSFRTSRNITRLFGSDDQEEHENENEAPPAETRRKAPDKKLKTSDGRPEHGFQPPVTSRDESRTSSNKQVDKIFSPKSAPIEKEEQRLREGRAKCRPRIVTSNNAHRDLRSNTDASLSIANSQETEVTNACKGERELDETKQPDSEDISFKGCFGTPSNDTRRDEQDRGKILSEEPTMLLQPKTSKTGPEKGFKSTFECISDPIEEKASLIRTVVTEESPKSFSGPNIFNFTEKEVEIKRLEDIVESSDTEQEPKKVKITDSDDDSFSLVDRKVEQTKDSGYKSAIVTPEPAERAPHIFNNMNQINMLNSDQFTADLSGNLKKTQLQELQSKSLSKFSSPGRRKNLEDVIEERKKAAEQTEVALAGLDKRNELPKSILSPPPFQMLEPEINYSESNEQLRDSQVPVSESTSAGSSVSSTSPAPSRFVEEWREQWGAKNSQAQPVQMDHMDAAPPYPPMPHHPGLPPSLNDFQYYMDMQANHYPNNLSVYINQLRMMQLALLSQQYAMPPKTHDNQLEEEASMLSDISARHARDEHTHRISTREHHSRLSYEEPQIHLPSKLEELELPSSISSSHSDIRHANEMKNVSTLPPSLPVQSERTITPIPICDSPIPGTPSCKSIVPTEVMKPIIKAVSPTHHIISSIPSPVDKHKPDVTLGVCTVLSKMITTTSTVTTASCKISTQPSVSPAKISLTDSSKQAQIAPITLNSCDVINSTTNKPLHSPAASLISAKTSTHTSVTSVISSTNRITSSTPSLTVSSPISSIVTPSSTVSTAKVICSPSTIRSPEISTVDTSILHSPSPQKRIPIYMQEAKTPKVPEKRSPRTATASSSPRWSKQDKKEKKLPVKSNRGKAGRGRGTMKRKRKNSRFNLASVPKELVGTVYDFDFDDEFDDDRPANNTLDDLRQLREKRQSIDAVPSQVPLAVPQNTTPTYNTELIKDQPPKKRVKEKKPKSVHKERTPKHEEVDEVAKILEDYRNQQNSTLKKSVHEPSPPQIGLYLEQKKLSPKLEIVETRSLEDGKFLIRHSPSVEERKKQENFKNGMESSPATFSATTVVTSSLADDRTNQLKLKIKGPYANSYPSSFNAPTQEMSSNPNPQSTTTTLRRMRKKELIRQYCYQDMNPEQGESNAASNSNNPPQQLRTGITLPKAVASMTSIPTREDYKMYTQDDSSSRSGNSSRRRRQPRELKQLDWTLLEEKGKRNTDIGSEGGRKRARGGKESSKRPQSDEKEDVIPLSNKLRISLGKKGSEVSQVTGFPSIVESTELCSKGKPPKKRHPEESTIMKVMSANLKFREEIMANFERSGNSKIGVGEKKSKKRKFGHLSESGNSPSNSDIRDEEMKVVKNDDSRKLVLKFSKKSDNGLCGTADDRVSGSNQITHPLKIRLSLANRSKEGHSSDPKEGSYENGPSRPSSREGRLMSLKIKLQRRPEGYVTSKSTEECPKDEGPGPPPKPPDPPSTPRNKLSASSSFRHTSIICPPSPPKDVSLCKTIPIEHKDRESLSIGEGKTLSAPTTVSPSLRPLPHSRISEDVLQQLEAQLAATDGGIPLPSLPSSVNTHNFPQSAPPSSFSALQAVPTLKDEFGCR